MNECLLCRRPATYICDGCSEPMCGYCAGKWHIVFIGGIMTQRLCRICSLADEGTSNENGFYSARHFNLDELKEYYEIESSG